MCSILSGVPETWWRLGDESARNPTFAWPGRRTPMFPRQRQVSGGCSCLRERHADTCISLPVRNSLNYECRFLSSCLPSSPSYYFYESSPIELRVLVRTEIDRVAMPDSMSSRRGFAFARVSGNAFHPLMCSSVPPRGEGSILQLKSCRISSWRGERHRCFIVLDLLPQSRRVARAEC